MFQSRNERQVLASKLASTQAVLQISRLAELAEARPIAAPSKASVKTGLKRGMLDFSGCRVPNDLLGHRYPTSPRIRRAIDRPGLCRAFAKLHLLHVDRILPSLIHTIGAALIGWQENW